MEVTMNEDFIQFVWKVGLFDQTGLRTTSGEAVSIVHPGYHNHDSGPDFLAGRVRIGDQEWAGNIEIHEFSSQWNQHGHDTDAAYDSVILHVVCEDDQPIRNSKGGPIPTIELMDRFDKASILKYRDMMTRSGWVACAGKLNELEPIVVSTYLNRMLVERLQRKAHDISQLLEANSGDWDEAFYRILARNFGFRVNAVPLSVLAANMSFRLLEKNRFNQFLVEVLLFGQAGFLEAELTDDYAAQLVKEFKHQKRKYSIQPMNRSMWRMSRLRPNNFPQLRMAQLSALLSREQRILSRLVEARDVAGIMAVFQEIDPHPYWRTHHDFDQELAERSARLGRGAIENIMINTVAPFLFVYGQRHDDQAMKDRSIELLHQVSPENNAVVRGWKETGIKADNAAQSQALLQLKNEMCNHRRCTSCGIGAKLLISDY